MFCSISGALTQEPVVSKRTGHVYEKRLIMKHLAASGGLCPHTNERMETSELIAVRQSSSSSGIGHAGGSDENHHQHPYQQQQEPYAELMVPSVVPPRTVASGSLPQLLRTLQSEWDAMMLEAHAHREQLDMLQKQLATALFEKDAALRVIARLVRERDNALAARDALLRGDVPQAPLALNANSNGSLGEKRKLERDAPLGSVQQEGPFNKKPAFMPRSPPGVSPERPERELGKMPAERSDAQEQEHEEALPSPQLQPQGMHTEDAGIEPSQIATLPEALLNSISIKHDELMEARRARKLPDSLTRADHVTAFAPSAKADIPGRYDFSAQIVVGHNVYIALGSSVCAGKIQVYLVDAQHLEQVELGAFHRSIDVWSDGASVSSMASHVLSRSQLMIGLSNGSVVFLQLSAQRNDSNDLGVTSHRSIPNASQGPVCDLAVNPTNELLAVVDVKGHCTLWLMRASEPARRVAKLCQKENVKYVSVSFHPDGKLLGFGCDDDTLRLWDVSMLEEIACISVSKSGSASGTLRTMQFSENGYQCVVSTTRGVQLLDLRKIKCQNEWTWDEAPNHDNHGAGGGANGRKGDTAEWTGHMDPAGTRARGRAFCLDDAGVYVANVFDSSAVLLEIAHRKKLRALCKLNLRTLEPAATKPTASSSSSHSSDSSSATPGGRPGMVPISTRHTTHAVCWGPDAAWLALVMLQELQPHHNQPTTTLCIFSALPPPPAP
ncbi:Pre-mRNA-processing factor 19 [Porphyridium purpureum]|uniref:Pre-mRNA-processing factor 19 n=1 Tax=Porphyridium purpureum TaxID=35688 RepID=A0A5J4YIC4_PORPP|nr:Pre-mRNA-processing factor 19 [Porphyridium purpureum]|eukprot:POR4378..scf261_15